MFGYSSEEVIDRSSHTPIGGENSSRDRNRFLEATDRELIQKRVVEVLYVHVAATCADGVGLY